MKNINLVKENTAAHEGTDLNSYYVVKDNLIIKHFLMKEDNAAEKYFYKNYYFECAF